MHRGWLLGLSFLASCSCFDAMKNLSESALFCTKIPLPLQSHFIGLDPPIDQRKWNDAIDTVCRGELVLLKRVHERVQRYEDIYAPDTSFRWNHHFADILVSNTTEMMTQIDDFVPSRAPVIHFGRRRFKEANFSGPCIRSDPCRPNRFIDFKGSFSRKVIAIGAMNENWGWLSTNILNR
jgi:hypothetical protein